MSLITELFCENICLLLKMCAHVIFSLLRPQLEKEATRHQTKATFEERCRKREGKLYVRIHRALQGFIQEKVISAASPVVQRAFLGRAHSPHAALEAAGLNTSRPSRLSGIKHHYLGAGGELPLHIRVRQVW